MDIKTINGKIQVQNERVGGLVVADSFSAYVCRPDGTIICRIRGFDSMPIRAKYVDISEIDFVVSKYVINRSTHRPYLNPCYQYIHAFACILVPELGKFGLFRINDEPVVNAQNQANETRTFTALSYESTLQYSFISNFKVNMGTPDSLEMKDFNLTPSGAPRERIKLYSLDESLSLLNLIFNDNNWYEWEIRDVDTSLWGKEASFDVTKKSIYSFLREDVQKAFRCIVEFDTVHKYINLYDIETVGRNTNILLSLDRFLQSVNVKSSRKEIYTVFSVSGGNGLSIASVNFGSSRVTNIDYPLSFMPEDLRNRYSQYKATRESKRQDYAELYKRYTKLNSQRSSILDRQPIDAVSNNWMSPIYYSLDELRAKLTDYQTMVTYIRTLYTGEGGEVDYAALDVSPYAAEYYSYVNVIIPDITAAISAREAEEESASTVDVSVQWQLYGLNDLQTKLAAYKNMVSVLREQGYTRPWSSTTDSISQATWDAHYAEYTSYTGYITELTALISDREQALAAIDAEIASLNTEMDDLKAEVAWTNWFSSREWWELIEPLYKETDYSDNNYLITDYDTDEDIADEAEGLYQAAVERLEVESRPQLSWTITSDNLYAIPEFEALRNSLQNGDFCTIAYGGHNRVAAKPVIETVNGETMVVQSNDTLSAADAYYKLRVIEIDFDGMNLSSSFGIVFSDTITTTAESNDFESLIGSYISSATSAVKADTLGASANNAYEIAKKIVEPYITAIQLQLEALKTQSVTIGDFNVVKITADQIRGGILSLGGYNNKSGEIKVYNANGVKVGGWTKDGVSASSGSIGGWTIDDSSIRAEKTYEEEVEPVYDPETGESLEPLDEPQLVGYYATLELSTSGDFPHIKCSDGKPYGSTIHIRRGEIELLGNDNTSTSGTTTNISNRQFTLVGKGVDEEQVQWIDTAAITPGQVSVTNSKVVDGSEQKVGSSRQSYYDFYIEDAANPQLASGIAHWTMLSARRQLVGTLGVTVYHCGNLFWAHFDSTDEKIPSGASGTTRVFLPIISGDSELIQSVCCAPPVKLKKYAYTHYAATRRQVEYQVLMDGRLGIQSIRIDSGSSDTASDYIETCDFFWAHV